jgi:hypothetical protein
MKNSRFYKNCDFLGELGSYQRFMKDPASYLLYVLAHEFETTAKENINLRQTQLSH